MLHDTIGDTFAAVTREAPKWAFRSAQNRESFTAVAVSSP